MYREEETIKAVTQNGFLEELQERLPGLDRNQVSGWASAVVNYLTQYLDDRQRRELAEFLPPGLVPVAEERERVVKLFDKEQPGDFFVEVMTEEIIPHTLQCKRCGLQKHSANLFSGHCPDGSDHAWSDLGICQGCVEIANSQSAQPRK